MEDNRLLRFVIAVLLTINVILYPIGKVITSPEKINTALDNINFEEKFLNIFEKFTASQLAYRFSTSTESIEEIISKSLISEKELREQRFIAVNSLYESISQKEVPILKFELENPLSKFQNNVVSISENVITQITDSINICADNPNNFICKGINELIDWITPESEVATSTSSTDISQEGSKLLTFETNLGINENNINRVYSAYRILKYGPDTLLLFTVIFSVIGYLITIPNTKFSINLLILGIKESIFAITIWYSIPILINLTNPIRVQSTANIETGLNTLLADIFYFISKIALILPLGFTILTGIITGILLLISKYKNTKTKQIVKPTSTEEMETISD